MVFEAIGADAVTQEEQWIFNNPATFYPCAVCTTPYDCRLDKRANVAKLGCMRWTGIYIRLGNPRVRVKMGSLVLGVGVPDSARVGDLVVGNRGSCARVVQPRNQFGGLVRYLVLEYAGNFYSGIVPDKGCKMHDQRGGT